VLDHGRGALLVTGGPGTGKTTLLRERFVRLVEAGTPTERVALFTLTRRAAMDAREALVHRLGRSVSELCVFSPHQYAYRTVVGRRFRELDYPQPPEVLTAPEQYAAVREMLQIETDAEWPRLGHLRSVPTFARQVADFVLRCQERRLSPEDVDALARRSDRPEYAELAAYYRRYADHLVGQTDFAGLLFQTANLLQGPLPDDERFDHVLVDDFQDFTHAGEAIVRALGRVAASVVIAADPDGHVFSFRGGSLEALASVDRSFPGLSRVALVENHRLGARAAALDALGGPDPSDQPPAGFAARSFSHPGEEVEAIAHELLRLRVDDDVPWSGMAVLLRRPCGYLTALRHALVRHGIPFVVAAEAATLASEPAVRPILDLLRFAFRDDARDDLLEPLLASTVVGLDPSSVRRLRREARLAQITLVELVLGADLEALRSAAPDLADAIGSFRGLVAEIPTLAADRGPDGLFFELWQRLPSAGSLVAATDAERAGGDPRSGRDLDALAGFARMLSRFAERRPGASIEDYLATLDAADFEADPWVPPEERRPEAVRVLSAHMAHGMEFDAVMVAGCLEGEFPSLSHGYPLVSLDRLVAPKGPAERIAERLAEERALFRLAVSRARLRTVLFASASTGARTPRSPSRYAARLGLTWSPGDVGNGPTASLRSMEAALRRRLADPSVDAARRLAAAAALVHVGAEPTDWWGRLDWTDGPALYDPAEPIRTSYSRLSNIENCGLQYLYSVELGLDQEQTHQMWVGTLVHGIIDRAQQRIAEGEKVSIEALEDELEEAWRPGVFPSRAVEHRRHLDALDMIRRWFHGEKHDVEASELGFSFPVEGAIVRGRIDAVFRMDNGHLRIVDYKTSRYPITEKETRENLQLAAYYLALMRDPELAHLGGNPGYLQLAYLGKGSQQDWFAHRGISPGAIEGYEEWAEGRIVELVEQVRAEAFGPNPEADCQWCRFRTICPLWPEGAEAVPS
jgi:superfamily I DNA/RNA helicase/RecB family exonuclease